MFTTDAFWKKLDIIKVCKLNNILMAAGELTASGNPMERLLVILSFLILDFQELDQVCPICLCTFSEAFRCQVSSALHSLLLDPKELGH